MSPRLELVVLATLAVVMLVVVVYAVWRLVKMMSTRTDRRILRERLAQLQIED